MRDIDQTFKSLGYAATQKQLYSLGFSKGQIARAVSSDRLQRVNRVWLTHPAVNPSIVTALRAGGVLGGASSLRSRRIWVTEPPSVVIVATDPRRPQAAAPGVRRHWTKFETDAQYPWRVTVADALRQYLPTARRIDAIATLDSALHRGQISIAGLEQLGLPAKCQPWLNAVDGLAEAGTESMVRVSARDRGWTVEPQVKFDGGRLDLVIDGWLCVECDSKSCHSDPDQIEQDLQRTLRLLRAGGRPVRLSYAEVVHDLDRTMEMLAGILAKGHPTRLRPV